MNYSKDLPKVSVLISVYNQLHCLEKALSSALAQNYPNLEIIIGDDCSSDGDVSAFVGQFNDSRVKYFRHQNNLGINGNYRSMLFDCASGSYAVILNADDYWTDYQFISKAVSIFRKHDDVSLVFGNIKTYISQEKKFIEDKMHHGLSEITNGNEFFINYTKGYSLPHLTCLYNKTKAVELNFYKNIGVSSDWEYLLKIIIGHNIGIIHSPVGVLTKHRQNYTKETNLDSLLVADNYIHSLYDFAANSKEFESHLLVKWQKKMLKRHHIKWLIKLWFLDSSKILAYKSFLQDKYPEIYSSIMYDIRYQGFLVIKKFPVLLRFIFRHALKQESFIADLIKHKKSRNEL